MFQDYDKLHAFYLMARLGGPSAAAEKLNLTQPALSKKLRDLEYLLGSELVIRKQGRFTLSRQGQELLEEIEPHFDRLKKITEGGIIEMEGEVRIGLFNWVTTQSLFETLSKLKMLYPNLRFTLRYMERDQIETALFKGELDFGFVVFIRRRQECLHQIFLKQKNILVASKEYIARYGNPSSKAEFLKHTKIDFDHNATALRYLFKKNRLDENELFADHVITEPDGALAAIRAGLGVGFYPESAASRLIPLQWPKINQLEAGIEINTRKSQYANPWQQKIWEAFAREARNS